MSRRTLPPNPQDIFHQFLDTLRRVLGADQPEKVATILGNQMLEAIDRAMPVAKAHALADLIRAMAEVERVYHSGNEQYNDSLVRASASLPDMLVIQEAFPPPEHPNKSQAVHNMLHELREAVGEHVDDYDVAIDRPLRRLLIDPETEG